MNNIEEKHLQQAQRHRERLATQVQSAYQYVLSTQGAILRAKEAGRELINKAEREAEALEAQAKITHSEARTRYRELEELLNEAQEYETKLRSLAQDEV